MAVLIYASQGMYITLRYVYLNLSKRNTSIQVLLYQNQVHRGPMVHLIWFTHGKYETVMFDICWDVIGQENARDLRKLLKLFEKLLSKFATTFRAVSQNLW